MIIVDINQVMISNFMMQIGNHTNSKIEENMLRHMILNSLRSYKVKFGSEYGDMIIACDASNCWRRSEFPYYKANRKKKKEESEIDWKTFFSFMEKVLSEIKENFPYKVIHVDTAEADDVIASLIKKFCEEDKTENEILILSADKDFIQLHKYKNVKQYDPVRKKWLSHQDPELYLKEHILKGDSGDGVPNILSSDNCFVIGQRQTPLTKKKIETILNLKEDELSDSLKRNYFRNKKLIDLTQLPNSIYENIISEYNKEQVIDRKNLINYFMKNKLNNLIEHLSEF